MVVNYILNLAASATRVSDVYNIISIPETPPQLLFDRVNIPYRLIQFQALVGDAMLGTDTSAPTKGIKLVAGATPIAFGPFKLGSLKFSEFWVSGPTGSFLMVMAVPL